MNYQRCINGKLSTMKYRSIEAQLWDDLIRSHGELEAIAKDNLAPELFPAYEAQFELARSVIERVRKQDKESA